MIRRDEPLGGATPGRWVLIGQPAHARLSYELAATWGGANVPPLVCPPDEPDHPLAGVRRELLDAILHHDDGWADWLDTPRIDPQHGRPYSFTEMPPAEAQQIWRDSIDACRAIGPLAGWVVASHFSALQSKPDEDFAEWVDWLARVDAERSWWLAEWLDASEHHTKELADRSLAWLQAFDWISLWLCCRCPALRGDLTPPEPLSLGGEATGWPAISFTPSEAGVLFASPWPFIEPSFRLEVEGRAIPVGQYKPDSRGERNLADRLGQPVSLVWRLRPAEC